jgi:hypothetical protein
VSAPETATELPSFFDEPFDLIEPPEAPPGAPAGEESDERRRRRRRRRRRPGEEPERRDSRRPAEAAESERSLRRPPAEASPGYGPAEGAPAEGPGEEEGGGEGPQRERRPRFRRERKMRPGEEPTAPRTKSSAAPKAEESDDLEMDLDIGEGEEADVGGESRGDRTERQGFRGIPTWEETVGILVTKNMESRSRRPDGGSQHGRNNRGGHGGRRRP